ncbi:MAG: IS6 family transposase [Burkholderiales bacterium]|nr:IS6 family transposase [Burkholderiales bacterium]
MDDFRKSLIKSTLRKVHKRLHYPLEVMMLCVRWYAACPLSFRHIEEMMEERGIVVDHAMVHRSAVRILPVPAKIFRSRKRPAGRGWRMDETYIKVKSQWKYLYRAVDREGQTIDFLLTARRDLAAARRFFERAIGQHDLPDSITIDKSGTNTAAIVSIINNTGAEIRMRQSKYLDNIVEQDHRAIKRLTRPMMGFKNFPCAKAIIAGIETMHMIHKVHKGQMKSDTKAQALSVSKAIYSLAF